VFVSSGSSSISSSSDGKKRVSEKKQQQLCMTISLCESRGDKGKEEKRR
jgi:hypothetical protein